MIDNKYIHHATYADGNQAYVVRVHGLPQHNKSFSFNVYGSKTKAFNAAKDYRDKTLKKIKWGSKSYIKNHPEIRDTSIKSCIVGVKHCSQVINGVDYQNWRAHCSINSKQIIKYFSINKYGDRDAFLMACKFRLDNAGELKIVDRSKLPMTVNKLKQYFKNHPFKKGIKYEL